MPYVPEFAELDRFVCPNPARTAFVKPWHERLHSDGRKITAACSGSHGAWLAGWHGPCVAGSWFGDFVEKKLDAYTKHEGIQCANFVREARRYPQSWNARLVFGGETTNVHGMTRETKKEPMRCFAEAVAVGLPALQMPALAAFDIDYIVDAFAFMATECDVYMMPGHGSPAYFLPFGKTLLTATHGAVVMPMRL